jgi:hypothetical protein
MIDVAEAAVFEHFGERAAPLLTVVLQTSKGYACAPIVQLSAALRPP